MSGLTDSPDHQVRLFAEDLAHLADHLPVASSAQVARFLAHLESRETGFQRAVKLLGKYVQQAAAENSGTEHPDSGPDGALDVLDVGELASRLHRLATQIRSCPGDILWNALWHVDEIDSSFSGRVDFLLDCAVPPTDEEIAKRIAIRKAVDEAVREAEEPWAWPDIDDPEFLVTVDFEDDGEKQPQLVLRVGDQEIYRRLSWHPGWMHLRKACHALADAYPGRVKDFQFAPYAHGRLVWEDDRAEGQIRKAFRPARKAYLRAKEERRSQGTDVEKGS